MLDDPNAHLTAFALKPLLPGEKGDDGITCFGGNPRLPDLLEWPCDAAGRPLHFLFQIDCAALDSPDPDIPDEGTLFFFAGCNFDNNDEDDSNTIGGATGSCVLYWPDAIDDEEERAPPENTPQLHFYAHVLENPWNGPLNSRRGEREVSHIYPAPLTYARVPLAVQPFNSHPDSEEDGLIAALPPEPMAEEYYTWTAPWLTETRDRSRNRPTVEIPESFPFRWDTIGATAAAFYLHLSGDMIEADRYVLLKKMWAEIPEAHFNDIRYALGEEEAEGDSFERFFDDAAQCKRFNAARAVYEAYITKYLKWEPDYPIYEPIEETMVALETCVDSYEEARKWIKRAAKRAPTDPASPKARRLFKDFLHAAVGSINTASHKKSSVRLRPCVMLESLLEAVITGTRHTLRAALADGHTSGIPQSLIEAYSSEFRWQRSLTPYDCRDSIRFVRPIQMLGYVPSAEDSEALDRAGMQTGSVEKAVGALTRLLGREDAQGNEQILLLQLPESPNLNFGMSGKGTIKFQISRRHLRKRAFDRAYAVEENLNKDGLWRAPRPTGPAPILPPDRVMPSIILKPLLPGEAGGHDTNRYGGKPLLPESLDWPKVDNGQSMNFVMQIDCSTLPRSLDHGEESYPYPPLPETGGLFFFCWDSGDPDDYDGPTFKVLHSAEPLSLQQERAIPDDARLLFEPSSDEDSHDKFYAELGPPVGLGIREFTVKPYAFVPYASCNDDYEQDLKPDHEDMMRDALPHENGTIHDNIFALPWMSNWYRFYREARKEGYKTSDHEMPLIEVPQTYPWRWINITEAIETYFQSREKPGEPHAHLWPQGIDADAKRWFKRAAKHNPLDRIPESDAAAYRNWLIALDAAGAKIPVERPDEKGGSPERSWRLDLEWAFEETLRGLGKTHPGRMLRHIRHDDTSDIPQNVLQADANTFRYNRSYSDSTNNHVHRPRSDRLFGAYYTQSHEPDDRIMLMHMPCNWSGGGYMIRFMIAPEDLAAERFDKTEAVIEW